MIFSTIQVIYNWMLLRFFCLFSCDLVITQLKVAAQKLPEEGNIFYRLLSKDLKVYLENGFPADFINNIC